MPSLLAKATVVRILHHRTPTNHRSFQSIADTYANYLQIYARDRSIHLGRRLHAYLIVNGFVRSTYLSSKLIIFYAQCGRTSDARRVFDGIPKSNLRRWIVLIGVYSRCGLYKETLDLLHEMQSEGLRPNRYVVPSILKACGNLNDQKNGEKMHCAILRNCLDLDVFVDSALVAMYSKCGRVQKARLVFDRMPDKVLVAWNSMVSGYAQHGFPREAWNLVNDMRLVGIKPNLVTWNTLIAGFSSVGDEVMVRDLFSMMNDDGVEPDVVSWTSVISGFVQSFHNEVAFDAFKQMMSCGVLPSSATISSLLPACATVADLRHGREIHGFAVTIGVGEDIYVSSSLVDMYAKCGFISKAAKLFEKMQERNTVTWNSMIFGYANHGYCSEAIDLFYKMVEIKKVKLDHLTFTAVFTACSHGGLVEVGHNLFHLMQEAYGIEPRLEHYACMVDLLGRAGKLSEAYDLIKAMPMEPDSFVWGALLGACRNHGNIELAEIAASRLFQLEPDSAGSCLLLSNLYADAGSWGNSTKLKKMMKRRRLKKSPGLSWMELSSQ